MASSDPSPAVVAAQLAQMREGVIEVLCAHFSQDHLTVDALEERLTRAYRAGSAVELRALLEDLPPLRAEGERGPLAVLAPSDDIPPRGVLMAVMGGTVRRGSWLVPRHLKVYAVMGAVEIDLREARFAPGVTEIEVFALMGAVEVIVPPGVQVQALGMGVMGGFDAGGGDVTSLDSSRPVLRVTGLAIMAAVETSRPKPSKQLLDRFERAWRTARRLGKGAG